MLKLFGSSAAYQEAPEEDRKLDQAIVYNNLIETAHDYIRKIKELGIEIPVEEKELISIERFFAKQIEDNTKKKKTIQVTN